MIVPVIACRHPVGCLLRCCNGSCPYIGPEFVGVSEGMNGRLLPVYRVRAWRAVNEDRPSLRVALARDGNQR